MKKIFFIGFNVGSGIEYTGKMFLKMLQEDYDVYEYDMQNPAFLIIEDIIKYKPDIIILNENFTRAIEAAYFYRTMNKRVKIIQILHGWSSINGVYDDDPPQNDSICISHYHYNNADAIFLLNFKPSDIDWHENFSNKNSLIQGYFPVDENEYKITTPWNERNDFCVVSNIFPLRLTTEFLNEVKNYPDIKIDCYGKKLEGEYKEYYKLFDSIENFNYKGLAEQKDISKILNKYKYLILAHADGSEIFYIALLQASCCGTIPLISNNRLSPKKHYKWIDWAEGLYFGCNTEKELVKNMKNILDTKPDLTSISNIIRKTAVNKFSFNELRKKFLNVVRSLDT